MRDEDLRQSMAISGRAPDFAMVVYVERLFMHCPKCILRSHLWQPDGWPDPAGTPSLAETTVKYGKLGRSAQEVEALVERDAKERLY